MQVRRLLLAFLLSIVVGLFASAISQASSFQSVQLGSMSSHGLTLGHAYDAVRNSSMGGGSSSDLGLAAGGDLTPGLAMGWANTPSIASTDAADSSLSLSTADSWGNPATLAKHFADHGADFGATSADEYASQASQFLQRSQAEGLPTRIDANGVIRIYDPATNEFGSFNANGTTRTYFAPDPAVHKLPTNWDYWLSQPGVSP